MATMIVPPPLTPVTPTAAMALRRVVAHVDLDARALLAHAADRGEGTLTAPGTLIVADAEGPALRDRYIVGDDASSAWGVSMAPHRFDLLVTSVEAYIRRRETYAQRLAAADATVDLVTERAWVALVARDRWLSPRTDHGPATLRVLHVPGYRACADLLGTRSSTVVAVDVARGIAVGAGTEHAADLRDALAVLLAPSEPIVPTAAPVVSLEIHAR